MSLVTVLMYRVECEAVTGPDATCQRSPQDDGDYNAWTDPGTALDEAIDADYFVVTKPDNDVVTLCPEHAPRCSEPACEVRLHDDEFGERCEDHAPDEAPA